MRHSFAPFGIDEAMYLSAATGIDYTTTDFAQPGWLCVSARDDDNRLMGLCCFERHTWFDWYFSIAVSDPRCITRRVMAAMFAAVFSVAKRVTAEVRPDDTATVRKAQRMGFEIEGYCRLAIEGRWDALRLGMTADTCRYLGARQRPPAARLEGIGHGQLTQGS